MSIVRHAWVAAVTLLAGLLLAAITYFPIFTALTKAVNPDLIILDVMMDTITEGFQVSYQLRNPDPKSEYAKYSKIPILMLTAIVEKKQMKFSTQKDGDFLPVDDFVEKPIRPQVLLEKVKKLLKK